LYQSLPKETFMLTSSRRPQLWSIVPFLAPFLAACSAGGGAPDPMPPEPMPPEPRMPVGASGTYRCADFGVEIPGGPLLAASPDAATVAVAGGGGII
jgi:hypothetical protein